MRRLNAEASPVGAACAQVLLLLLLGLLSTAGRRALVVEKHKFVRFGALLRARSVCMVAACVDISSCSGPPELYELSADHALLQAQNTLGNAL
jgi:hypothetical protein